MKIIKGVLEEELANSLQMKERYQKAIEELPRGVLIQKKVAGHVYFYLMFREGKKVRFEYKGKLSEEEIKKFDESRKLRAKYKELLAQVKKQISFLERTLRGKQIRSLS